jgi:hypothetical protein
MNIPPEGRSHSGQRDDAAPARGMPDAASAIEPQLGGFATPTLYLYVQYQHSVNQRAHTQCFAARTIRWNRRPGTHPVACSPSRVALLALLPSVSEWNCMRCIGSSVSSRAGVGSPRTISGSERSGSKPGPSTFSLCEIGRYRTKITLWRALPRREERQGGRSPLSDLLCRDSRGLISSPWTLVGNGF